MKEARCLRLMFGLTLVFTIASCQSITIINDRNEFEGRPTSYPQQFTETFTFGALVNTTTPYRTELCPESSWEQINIKRPTSDQLLNVPLFWLSAITLGAAAFGVTNASPEMIAIGNASATGLAIGWTTMNLNLFSNSMRTQVQCEK